MDFDEIDDAQLDDMIRWLRECRLANDSFDGELWTALGAALAEKYARTRDDGCLHEMAEIYRQVVDELPDGDLVRVEALDQLVACSLVWIARADQGHERNRLAGQAFQWLGDGAPHILELDRDHLAQRWYDLAVVSGLADDVPDAEGLRLAITALRRALQVLGPDDAVRRDMLFQLGLALVDRHDLLGDPHDLDAAIEAYTLLCSDPLPRDDQAERVEHGELLVALVCLLNRRATPADRATAVGWARAAVDTLPREHDGWNDAVEQMSLACAAHALLALGLDQPRILWNQNTSPPTPMVLGDDAARAVDAAAAHCREVLRDGESALSPAARGHLLTALGVILGKRAATTAAAPRDHIDARGHLRTARKTLAPGHELHVLATLQLGESTLDRARHTGDPALLDEAAGLLIGVLDRCGDVAAAGGEVVGNLAMLVVEAAMRGLRPAWYTRAVTLVEDAAGAFRAPASDVPVDAALALRGVLGAAYAWQAGVSEDGALAVRAIALCQDVLHAAPAGHAARPNAEAGLALALINRFQMRGDLRDVDAALVRLHALVEELPPEPAIRAPTMGTLGIALAVRAMATEHDGHLQDAITHLRACVAHLPAGHPVVPAATAVLGALLHVRATRSAIQEGTAVTGVGVWELLRAAYAAPVTSVVGMDARARLAAILTQQGIAVAQSDQRMGVWLLRQAADILQTVLMAERKHRPRIGTVGMLGVTQLALAQHTADRSQLDAAVHHLETAEQSMVDGPAHTVQTDIVLSLGRAYRLQGHDLAAARAAGMRALLGFGWQVMVQVGTDNAVVTARGAADVAAEVASWCVADGTVDEAVGALEAGRGLVLHAVTATAGIPDLLRAAGHDALAHEWEAMSRDRVSQLARGTGSPPEAAVPDDLRHRVLRVLGGVDGPRVASPLLLVPPEVGELRRAVAEIGADALVYLVPRTTHAAGMAVAVLTDGGTEAVPLPDLDVGAGTAVGEYAAALSARLHGTAGTEHERKAVSTRWQEALLALCDWAWPAAMGPLLQRLGAHASNPVPRLVLVPVGLLGLVPWHAARRRHSAGRWRYAVHDAVVSVAASGRLLREVAGRRPRPHDGRAVIVGDPTGDLPGAASEALGLHRLHYPRAAYLGGVRSPEGDALLRPRESEVPMTVMPATPEEVLARLPGGTRDDRSPIYHLACHGHVGVTPSASYLVLAGGRRLTIDDILDQARTQVRVGDGAVVTLAACTSSLAEREHDEALTLATAFLVAGSATVVGALWQVPDRYTATLMLALHHFITTRRQGEACVDALRQAQLWMLDPARAPLPGVDEDPPVPGAQDRLARPLAWAGFVHAGR